MDGSSHAGVLSTDLPVIQSGSGIARTPCKRVSGVDVGVVVGVGVGVDVSIIKQPRTSPVEDIDDPVGHVPSGFLGTGTCFGAGVVLVGCCCVVVGVVVRS